MTITIEHDNLFGITIITIVELITEGKGTGFAKSIRQFELDQDETLGI